VATPGGLVAVSRGLARVATAGTGDVLSGVIGAFLDTGLDAFEAAAAGVLAHASAGQGAGAQAGGQRGGRRNRRAAGGLFGREGRGAALARVKRGDERKSGPGARCSRACGACAVCRADG